MEPMKPMAPMKPLGTLGAEKSWWDSELGEPSSTGSSNDTHYAFFANKHRLAVREHGKVKVFDTGSTKVHGFKSSGDGKLSFDTDQGPAALSSFKAAI